MKKYLKRILVLLLVLACFFAVSGCAALDEMRKNQAFFNGDGDILWNGNTYMALPSSDYLQPEIDYSTDIYITDPDVPVLLSSTAYLLTLSPSEDGALLMSYEDDIYYCIDSLYDDLYARINAPFKPDKVCYSYDVYHEETYEFETAYYTLTQAQLDTITQITETVTPTTIGNGIYLDYQFLIQLEAYSEDMLLRQSYMDIGVTENSYYVLLVTDTGELAFEVPQSSTAIFDEIVKAYLEG